MPLTRADLIFDMLKKLNNKTASKPADIPVRIMQFGKGNFLRGFADWMIDIMNEKAGFNGAVRIVQVNSQSDDEHFRLQDGLYHVVLNGVRHGRLSREIRLISCIDSIVNPFEDYEAYLKGGENPDLQFVISNTTEAGIRFEVKDEDPDILPQTFPGKLTGLLYHRFKFFDGDKRRALTILPCELIERNGEVLRDSILQYVAHWRLPEAFRRWISDHTLFCNTLVDRIVPGFPNETFNEIWEETGYEDHLIVSGEPFYLWVIEPVTSPAITIPDLKSRLPFEKAGLQGVKFVEDLSPYRTMKVRILNGAHTAMVPVGYLRGLRTVREGIEDKGTGDFIREAVEEEIIPTLDLPKEELQQFANDVFERFQNPFIRHELMSIALNSISKYQVRVLPSVLEYNRRTGKLPERLLYSLAALIVFYRGAWRKVMIPLKDTPPVIEFFQKAWRSKDPSNVVQEVLSNETLWKTDLTRIEGLRTAVLEHVVGLLKDE